MQTRKTKMNKLNVFKYGRGIMVVLLAIFVLASCNKDNDKISAPAGAYSNGFFILNEGWFGIETGSVNFYGYGADTLQEKVFSKENDGSAPTTLSAPLEDGVIINNQMFLISKSGGPITVADPATLKQTAQITMSGSDFRSMAAIDNNTAVVSSGNSIYTIDLTNLTINTTAVFTGSNIKKLYVSGKYLLASDQGGVDIIQLSDWKSVSHFDGPTEGYVQTPDGKVYGAGGNLLVAVDAAHQDTTQIALGQPIWRNDYAYNAPSIVSSARDNAVFYIAGPDYSATKIYRYVKGMPASLTAPFITLPSGESFYGTGLGYDKKNDQIITWSITGYTETDKNFLRFYNASTGALVKTIEYGHLYFPANIVFYP